MCAGVVVLLGLTAGCAENPVHPGGQDSRGEQSGSALVESGGGSAALPVGEEVVAVKDQARWTLPLDPYWAPRTSNLERQATSLLMSECMATAGFPQYKPWWDMNKPAAENQAGNGIGTFFNETLAAKYGYHQAPEPRYTIWQAIKEAGGALHDDETDDYWQQFGACEVETGQALGRTWGPGGSEEEQPTDGVRNQMDRLRWESTPVELVDAAARWRECMAPAGIAGLPEQPWAAGSMLPDSLMEKWDWWQPAGEPRAEEIELAVIDAQCRRSSGWFDVYYDALWDLQEKFVNEHKDDLTPLLEKNKEDAKRYEEIINQHSGK